MNMNSFVILIFASTETVDIEGAANFIISFLEERFHLNFS